VLAGGIATATIGAWVVLMLLACGCMELVVQRGIDIEGRLRSAPPFPLVVSAAAGAAGGLLALVWVALKVGALSFGGGFVIIPLMQGDAVQIYHWMTSSQFLGAVALGQLTPGPVVATIAAVGYAAHGVGGAALAAGVAFLPSF